jgi:feruloyl esterase
MHEKTIKISAMVGFLLAGSALAATRPAASSHAKLPISDASCRTLAAMALPGAKVTSSEMVAAGAFKKDGPDMLPDFGQRLATAPAFCRVRITATPTTGSRIGVEVWLPIRGWNGRMLGTGNGGGAGSIAYEMGMVEGLKRGFAVANTDMGTAPDINTVLAQPERWADFGYRATHEMTRVAKLVVAAYYRVASFRSYFAGCSTGGQQALGAAQRYPADYDGIVAGDPGNNRTHVASAFVWNHATLTATPGAALTAGQWSTVSRTVMKACGGKDGGAPGDMFLTDPRQCTFDPATLPVCKAGAQGDACFTAEQIGTVRRLYAGPVNPATGERIYPGMTVGSEDLPLGPMLQGSPGWPAQQFYPFEWALGRPFDASKFDFNRDLDKVDARLAAMLNANSADLSDFARRGGRLILYTGIADPAVPFAEVVNYYDRIVAHAGDARAVEQYARLFLVPGMGHCFGGPGVTNIGQWGEQLPESRGSDILMRLVDWTERGTMPNAIIATKAAEGTSPARERPVCAYPSFPEYRGGDPARATSFECRPHARGTTQAPALRYLN